MKTASSFHPIHAGETTLFRQSMPRSSAPAPLLLRMSRWYPIAVWAVFLVGLLLQVFSPHLQVAHDSFVIPQDLLLQGTPVDPHALVQKERIIQVCSALLVLAGAVGLTLYYRRTLLNNILGKDEQ